MALVALVQTPQSVTPTESTWAVATQRSPPAARLAPAPTCAAWRGPAAAAAPAESVVPPLRTAHPARLAPQVTAEPWVAPEGSPQSPTVAARTRAILARPQATAPEVGRR